MGQDLKYIITTEDIKLPIHIVHFKEKNAKIIPLLMDDNTFSEISNLAKECNENIKEYLEFIVCGPYYLEYPTKRVLEHLMGTEIKSFAIIAYREILDLLQNIGDPVLYINNKRIDLTSEEMSEEKIHRQLGAEITFTEIINNEQKYWCYENAEFVYLNNLNKEV